MKHYTISEKDIPKKKVLPNCDDINFDWIRSHNSCRQEFMSKLKPCEMIDEDSLYDFLVTEAPEAIWTKLTSYELHQLSEAICRFLRGEE